MDQKIQERLAVLSRAEARVGEWIVSNMDAAIDASIAQVAELVGVSEPTVIRFCRSMGTSGFRDLRKHLIAAQHRPASYSHHDVEAGDSAHHAGAKVIESSIRALVDLRPLVSTPMFDQAIGLMRVARQLVFVGVGASGQVVQDARHKFFRLGIPCAMALDAQSIRQQAAIGRTGDVFVAVSHTGSWPELVEPMEMASARGATVITLTDPDSPLAASARVNLGAHPTEDTSLFTPMTSRLAQLVLLDALQVGLALALGPSAEENLRHSKLALKRGDATF